MLSVSLLFCTLALRVTCLGANFIEKVSLSPQDAENVQAHEDMDKCALYLAPSTIPNIGRGVIAGKAIESYAQLDMTVTVTIPYDWVTNWSLANYVFNHDEEEQAIVAFGIGMMLNHGENETVSHHWITEEPVHTNESMWTPSTMMTPVSFNTLDNIRAGQELLISYGDNDWFHDRGIPLRSIQEASQFSANTGSLHNNSAVETQLLSQEDMDKFGFCISNVYIGESTKPLTNYGVFAGKPFKKGEVVTISPVLALPMAEAAEVQQDSVLYNYLVSEPGSEVALLPIGYAGLLNHDRQPNLEYDWYAFPDNFNRLNDGIEERIEKSKETLQRLLSLNVSAILNSPYSQLDLQYIASRDIEAHEELTIDYGIVWINNWADYLAHSLTFHSDYVDEKGNKPEHKIFREYIQAPNGLFPKQWHEPLPFDNAENVTLNIGEGLANRESAAYQEEL